jgi:hypothetical protein
MAKRKPVIDHLGNKFVNLAECACYWDIAPSTLNKHLYKRRKANLQYGQSGEIGEAVQELLNKRSCTRQVSFYDGKIKTRFVSEIGNAWGCGTRIIGQGYKKCPFINGVYHIRSLLNAWGSGYSLMRLSSGKVIKKQKPPRQIGKDMPPNLSKMSDTARAYCDRLSAAKDEDDLMRIYRELRPLITEHDAACFNYFLCKTRESLDFKKIFQAKEEI